MARFINIGIIPTIFNSLQPGESSSISGNFRGVVTEKTSSSNNFVFYKVCDLKDENKIFTVTFKSSHYYPIDGMTFVELHDDVSEGDYVSIIGYPTRSKRGSFYIKGSFISVKVYGMNHYQTEDEDGQTVYTDEEDEEYVPNFEEEDEEEEEEEETVYDSAEEEEDYESDEEEEESDEEEEEEEEVVKSDFTPTIANLAEEHISIKVIPLTIYRDFVNYNGYHFSILSVMTDTPGKIIIKTSIADFHITRQARKFVGIFVTRNPMESDEFPKGYDVLLKRHYYKFLELLY